LDSPSFVAISEKARSDGLIRRNITRMCLQSLIPDAVENVRFHLPCGSFIGLASANRPAWIERASGRFEV
jgi:hypothetical protein